MGKVLSAAFLKNGRYKSKRETLMSCLVETTRFVTAFKECSINFDLFPSAALIADRENSCC